MEIRNNAISARDPDFIKQFESHTKKNIGKIVGVMQEKESSIIHNDLYLISPYIKDYGDFQILLTRGMSEIPMISPEHRKNCKFAELMIFLPKDWKLTPETFKQEKYFWPIRELKKTAFFPHIKNDWIWAGETIQNGNPPKPYSQHTEFCCSLLTHPLYLSHEAWTLTISPEKQINFFVLMFLYKE